MDPVHFSGREILEMALRIEENGKRFYADAARASRSDRLRDIFTFLVEEEKRHTEYFKGLLKGLDPEASQAVLDPYAEEARLYINALADSEVFTAADQGEVLANTVGGEKEALEYAIKMEKDSLLFYYELLSMVREKDRGVVNRIIQEEKKHLTKLNEVRKEIFG